METTKMLTFRLTLAARDAAPFTEAMRGAGYEVTDTGERITTDAGMDAEHVIAVRVPHDACLTHAQRIHNLLRV